MVTTGFVRVISALSLVAFCKVKAACKSDEVEFQGSCYYFGTVIENEHQSHRDCIQRGGHLASINTKEENTFLKTQAKHHNWGGTPYIIGGTDTENEGTWKWEDGTTMTFTDWAPGEPNNFLNAEDCLTLYRPLGLLSDYHWGDVSCDVPAEMFICERPVAGGSETVTGAEVVG